MNKEDEELQARVKLEQDKHGLVLKEHVDGGDFHKVMQRLIEEPPVPKRERIKRGVTKPTRRRKK
jgi:hypothetical protein